MVSKRQRLLLAVDLHCSLPALYMLHSLDTLLERDVENVRIILMTVAPLMMLPVMPDTALSAAEGLGLPHLMETVLREEQQQAQETLARARAILEEQIGIEPEFITCVQRVGRPADEVVKAAKTLAVDHIIVGSRGNTFWQRVRRFFNGSISHSIVTRAHCPVTVVTLPPGMSAESLVGWYEAAIRNYLGEHPRMLHVLTAHEVAHMFLPPRTGKVGRKEIAAAQQALKLLTQERVLHLREVSGEARYIND